MTVAEIITNTIIKKLEEGQIPWIKPWQGGEAVNYITQKPYTGINRLLLDGGEYLTFKQIQDLKGHLKKGAKSHIVVFYKPLEIVDDESEDLKIIRYLRYYRVYSISDVEGIDSKQIVNVNKNYTIDKCESIVNEYITKTNITLKNMNASGRAYYSPSNDEIVVPVIGQFDNSKSYYATVYHEMAHSTGHESRLNRLSKTAHFGNSEYSREELTAEITSAMLCKHTGIDTAEILDNAAGYIQSWLKALKNDKNMILVASAKAEAAYDYILKWCKAVEIYRLI